MMTFEELSNHPDRRDPIRATRLFMRVLHWLSINEPAAREMIPLFLPKPQLKPHTAKPSGFTLGMSDDYLVYQLVQKPQIMRSYFGGTPENNYVEIVDFEPEVDSNPPGFVEEKEAKLFVKSAGKDHPTPIGLKRNNEGIWKVFNWSSFATGVRPTLADEGDF